MFRLAGSAAIALLSFVFGVACEDEGPSRVERSPAAVISATATLSPAPSVPARTSTTTPGGRETSPSGTATATQVGTAAPTTTGRFRTEAPVDLPDGLVLWVELGCFQCDGPTTGLRRVYRDRAGRVRTDDALPRQVRGTQGYLSGMAFAPDGSDIVLAWCASGNCGPAGPVSPGARTTLYRSRDGGITYDELARYDEVYDPVLLTGGRVLVAGPYRADGTPSGYRLLPGNEPVSPPAAGGGRPYPVAGADGAIWWSASATMSFVDRNGVPAITVRGSQGEQIDSFITIPGSSRLAYTAAARDRVFTGIVERDGTVVREFVSPRGYTALTVMLDERTGTGNATVKEAELGGRAPSPFVDWLPALIDMDAGTVIPVAGLFLDEPFRNGRNRIRAATRGVFARVVNTGSCLNLRERPDPAAAVVTCAADGVLARVQATAQPAAGPWFNLRLPDGREGWASGQYLER